MKTSSVGWRERIVGCVASVLLCGGMLLVGGVAIAANAVTPTPSVTVTSGEVTPSTDQSNAVPSMAELARSKLGEEIRQLQLANSKAEGFLAEFLPLAPFVTVLVAASTLVAALWKQSSDARAIREKAAADGIQRELARFDDTLNRISAQISSDNPGLSLNGAAAIGIFLKPRYQDLHSDLLRIIIANLKASPKVEVTYLLRDDLAKVLKMLFLEGKPNPDVPSPLNLTHLHLYRLDLHGLKLPENATLDFAFATLDDANLSEMTMARARGFKAKLDAARFSRTIMTEARFNGAHATVKPVHFHETRLVSATFDDALLPGAEFQQAKLQGAKFRRCDLRGARFEGADVNDAYFQGAILDEVALRSIALGAHNWLSAHFDPVAFERIKEISQS